MSHLLHFARPPARIICMAFLLACAFRCTAAEAEAAPDARGSTPAQMPQGMREALDRLGADDWRQRDQAQLEIIELGAEAIPWLEALLRSAPDAEVATRAEAVLRQIAFRQATSPTLVSLRLNGVHPRQVVEGLCRQGGMKLAGDTAAFWDRHQWPLVDFEADREPFWMALLRISRQASLEPGLSRNNGALALSREDDPNHWRIHQFVAAGPFTLLAGEVRLAKTGEPMGDDSGIELAVFADPRFKVLFRYPIELQEAVDEHGQSLLFPYRPASAERSEGEAWMWEAQIPLQPPDGVRRPQRVARLRGNVHAAVQMKSEQLKIPNVLLARGERHRVGRMPVLVEQVQQRTDSLHVHLVLNWIGQNLQDWQLQQAVLTARHFRLLDAAGRTWTCDDLDTDLHPDRILIRLQFETTSEERNGERQVDAKPVGPLDLIADIPTETRQLTGAFELKDLPVR